MRPPAEPPPFSVAQRGVLASLRSALADSAAVLHAACELVDEAGLRKRFRAQAHAWNAGAATLGDLLSEHSEPTAAAALRRAWINVKSAVGDTPAIVAECRRHADSTSALLDAACSADFPEPVRQTLFAIRRQAS